RDNRIKTLFKEYFQGQNPTKLSDQEIELWRITETGLPNTGKDQRIAYENGWENPSEIQNSQTSYQNISQIEVLTTKKAEIDQEISKVNNLVQQINSYKFLRDLDANQTQIDKTFSELKTNLLPPNKSDEITQAVEKQRQNLFYSLIDPQDGGLPEETLKKLTQNLQNTWNVPNYEPMTVAKLNQFIAADKDVQELGLFKPETKWEDLTQSGWLKEQGGYEIPKDKTNAEDKLDISQKGTHLLKFFYDKCKDGKGYPFNPDKLTDPAIHFCQIGTKMVKKFKKKMIGKGEWIEEPTEVIGGDKGTAGHLAIGTGIGKSTKVINCLVCGGKRHIILVTTNQTLVDSAFKHHSPGNWLQPWGCVFHGGAKGETEMAYVIRGTMERATEEDIKLGKHDPEMKSLYKSHGTYPVIKNDLAYWYNANTGKNEGLEPDKKGLSVMYYGNLLGFAARNLFVESGGINSWVSEQLKKQVKDKLIPKEETIIVFDEADWNDAGFQALQFEMIKAGYKCIRMSATFPGVEFSATSTYPRKIMYTGRLDPNMPAGLMRIRNADHAEKLEIMRGLPPGSIKWQDENGQPIFAEVNTEEMVQTGRIWIFLKSLKLNDEQIRILGSNTSYMLYLPEFDNNCEEITHGRPDGSADGVDGDKDRGVSPKIDGVICLGVTETTNLQKFFTYSEPALGLTSKASSIQQFGRVGRHDPGLVITLIKEFGEIDLSDNVSAAMVKANFDGNIKQINDKEYKQIYDIDILRGALSYPDPKTFGKAPEEILMGLKITKDQQSKKEKLSQLVWRQDNEADKAEALAKPWYAFMASDINPSEKLWNKYLGKSDKITMGEETAKNLLKEMISNFIVQNKKYPQG
ncbi:MAG: hypothetical protein I3275_07865, partial [Candidatus Moeniiplasma glomeromycotorum]|nr:hypothetical protein [Candidatus Moeniiplasma glomeromycotorum]